MTGTRLLSLFSGCGGMDEGFLQAGFEVGAAYDVSWPAVQSYSANHVIGSKRPGRPTRVYVEDLSYIEPRFLVQDWLLNELEPPIGIIGGPPCQAFSIGNSRPKTDDPRAKLVYHYGEILSELARAFPLKFFVLENVSRLSLGPQRTSLDSFIKTARKAGFSVSENILDAQYFGVPQRRSRVFVVGLHKDAHAEDFLAPAGSILAKAPTVRDTIGHLPDPKEHSPGLKTDATWYHPNHWAPAAKSEKFRSGALSSDRIQGRSFRVLKWDEPSWTVAYGHREVHVHPTGTRRLSVYEAMLLQGFPKSYELKGTISQQITQVSDAVPPPLAKAAATAIASQLQLGVHPAPVTQEGSNGQSPHLGFLGVHTASPISTSA
jgi:DNA (cytosine-5)-methyltransferase 1